MPPFSLYSSILDIDRDAAELSSKYGADRFAQLRRFAKTTPIARPSVLDRLPECIPLRLTRLDSQNVIRERHVSYRTVANSNPLPDYAVIRDVLGPEILDRREWDPEAAAAEVGKALCVEIRSPQDYLRIIDILRNEVYRYVKTGKPAHLVKDVKKAVVLCTILSPDNEDILYAFTHARPNDAWRQQACAELLFCRIPAYLDQTMGLDLPRLCRNIRNKTHHLHVKTAVRATIISWLGAVATREQYRDLALRRAPALLAAAKVPETDRRRVLDMLTSGVTDLDRARSVFEAWFLPRELAGAHAAHTSRTIGKAQVTWTTRVLNRKTTEDTLLLYPSKDYLDFVKGSVSNDCTDCPTRAAAHLRAPEFFNLRICRGEAWIGNIYCLDLTSGDNAVIIDRIQIPHASKGGWMAFFPTLRSELTKHLPNVRILLPSTISNNPTVRTAFNALKKELRKKPRVANTFGHGRRHLAAFESISQHKKFYVLESGDVAPISPTVVIDVVSNYGNR